MRYPISLATFLSVTLVIFPGLAAAECEALFAESGKPTHSTGGESNIDLCRLGYFVSFDPETKVPDWVQERIDTEQLTGNAKRSNNYKPDPDLPKDVGPTLADYRGSGYDRGHQAPAGDMSWSQQANDESFYLSNMAPQVGRGFNRGVWRALETQIRNWVEAGRSPLVVATGPVYGHQQLTIGNGVVVPAQFYKVVFDPINKEAIGFLLPNAVADFNDYKNRVIAIDAIETMTGLDFLTNLSEAEQIELESTAAELWE
jgi:endonuclease G